VSEKSPADLKRELAERQAAIDRYGEARRQYSLWSAPVNPHAAELAEAKAAIEALYVDHPADQRDLAEGLKYQLDVSERHFERELTPDAKQKAFYKFQRLRIIEKGDKIVRFPVFSVFSVTLDAIEKHLGEKYLDLIAPKHRTGPRTYKAIAKEAA
jgi:transcriptional regulator GlxA family with amidase domain